jgi:AraC-like DNA-binding protein
MSPVDQTRMSRDVRIEKTRREPACFQPTVAPPRGVLHAAEDRGSSFFHRRLAPPPELAPFVQHFWFVLWDLRDATPSRAETFPHPSCYLVFEHDLEQAVDDPSVLRRAEVSGMTTGKFSRSMEGHGRVFGLKFQPGSLRPFFHTSASVLTNRVVHASEIFGSDILALAKQLRPLDSPEDMTAAVAAYFVQRLPARDSNTQLAIALVNTILHDPAILSVEALSRRSGQSVRSLQRLFREYVGASPKWVIRRFRLHELLERFHSGEKVGGAQLALELGYADLSGQHVSLQDISNMERAKPPIPGDGDSVESAGFFREYGEKVGVSYSKPWPRPWPCGTVWLKWDPRWVEPVAYSLNPANGVFDLQMKIKTLQASLKMARLSASVDWDTGLVSVQSDPIPGVSVIYCPALDGFRSGAFDAGHVEVRPDQLPGPELKHQVRSEDSKFSCFQYFPAIGPSKENPHPPRSENDRNCALLGRIAGAWSVSEIEATRSIVFSSQENAVPLDVAVVTPRDLLLRRLEAQQRATDQGPQSWITIPQTHAYSTEDLNTPASAEQVALTVSKIPFEELKQRSEARWREHWRASAVRFQDEALERIWYHNQYFLACCLPKNRTAPGLFANWSSGEIGSAWHSDYHLDYNCQQIYWGVFSSNHIDMHQPYLELVENLLPMSEKFAQDSFHLAGAFFPLSAYPVPSQIVPYPVPPWGYQICMTPWAVQSLWWRYLYTMDGKYLQRVIRYSVLPGAFSPRISPKRTTVVITSSHRSRRRTGDARSTSN